MRSSSPNVKTGSFRDLIVARYGSARSIDSLRKPIAPDMDSAYASVRQLCWYYNIPRCLSEPDPRASCPTSHLRKRSRADLIVAEVSQMGFFFNDAIQIPPSQHHRKFALKRSGCIFPFNLVSGTSPHFTKWKIRNSLDSSTGTSDPSQRKPFAN